MASVISSRGCYGTCTFCSIRAFYRLSSGPSWRARSAANVVDEIEQLVERFGIARVNFLDDEFFGAGRKGLERAWAIGEAIRKRRLNITFNIVCRPDSLDEELLRFLKEVGLTHVSVGLESWVPRQLVLYGKRTTVENNRRAVKTLERAGIDYMFFLIPADPYVTAEELIENLDRIEEAGIQHAADGFTFSQLLVFPGTSLERRFADEGILDNSRGKRYLGPLSCAFRDNRTRRIYAQWGPILKEYADLRSRIADLGVQFDEQATGIALGRYCQQALNNRAHRLFRTLVRAEQNGAHNDFAALAQDELDRLVSEELLGGLTHRPAPDGPLSNSLWTSIKGPCDELLRGYDAARRRLAALIEGDENALIPDAVFARGARRALRSNALALLARVLLLGEAGKIVKARQIVVRAFAALALELAVLENLAREGEFRRFSPREVRFAGKRLQYPSAAVRRLSRQLMRRLAS
jgi:hypothetical protein